MRAAREPLATETARSLERRSQIFSSLTHAPRAPDRSISLRCIASRTCAFLSLSAPPLSLLSALSLACARSLSLSLLSLAPSLSSLFSLSRPVSFLSLLPRGRRREDPGGTPRRDGPPCAEGLDGHDGPPRRPRTHLHHGRRQGRPPAARRLSSRHLTDRRRATAHTARWRAPQPDANSRGARLQLPRRVDVFRLRSAVVVWRGARRARREA